MLSPGVFCFWWQLVHFNAYTPLPSGPRFTPCGCKWLSSPFNGISPEGWQFIQRGDINTLYTCIKALVDIRLSRAVSAFISSQLLYFLSSFLKPSVAANVNASIMAVVHMVILPGLI